MSWQKELKRIRHAQYDAEKQRREDLDYRCKLANRSVRLLSPMVIQLLDSVAQAQWGRGLVRKPYDIHCPTAVRMSPSSEILPATWTAVERTAKRVLCSYTVELWFSHEGKPAYWDVKGHANRRIEKFTESALREALTVVFESGPRLELLDEPVKLRSVRNAHSR